MKGKYLQFGLGLIVGGLLCGTTATAAANLTASPTSQTFYINGQKVEFEAYVIHGNNFVKLRDIGQAVDFGVIYDGNTNSVYIDPNSPYQEEVKQTEQDTGTPSVLTEEYVQATIRGLRDKYPHGVVYETPYRPNAGLERPFDNCDHCAGWAMLCSDAAFGNLPWRRIDNPRWENIKAGDVIVYKNTNTSHAIVVLEKTAEQVIVTESGTHNKVLWSGQYPRWWLEGQPDYRLYTRYPA